MTDEKFLEYWHPADRPVVQKIVEEAKLREETARQWSRLQVGEQRQSPPLPEAVGKEGVSRLYQMREYVMRLGQRNDDPAGLKEP